MMIVLNWKNCFHIQVYHKPQEETLMYLLCNFTAIPKGSEWLGVNVAENAYSAWFCCSHSLYSFESFFFLLCSGKNPLQLFSLPVRLLQCSLHCFAVLFSICKCRLDSPVLRNKNLRIKTWFYTLYLIILISSWAITSCLFWVLSQKFC